MTISEIKFISIIIPVYNEEACLPLLLPRVLNVCQQLAQPFEIIMIDDGSHDKSSDLMTQVANTPDSPFIAILLNRNYGQHAAIRAGFEIAKGDLIITLDADLQNPPEEIPRLIAMAKQGYDVVGTIRRFRNDPWFRQIASILINKTIKSTTGIQISDYGCMLRAYSRPIVDRMLSCHERNTFIPILANSFARRTIEIDVKHVERKYGVSKYHFSQLINLMFDLVTCITTKPLRLLSIIGFVISLFGFFFSALIIIMRLILGTSWAVNGVFTLFAILFSFIGVQLLGMGLLGEYLGRIYNDVRARPLYFIHQIVRSSSSGPKKDNQI